MNKAAKYKFASVVILYNPSNENLKTILLNAIVFDKLYIIDNSENNNFLINSFTHLKNCVYVKNGINEGIAKRLNQACDLAIKDGMDYLLTMDQDSYFDESHLSKYFSCIETIREKSVSMFGIHYQQKKDELNCKYNEVKLLITSGSVINLKSYKEIGGFDENLFIDFVDTEYCFKSIQKGYKIIEFSNIYMHHSLGKSVEKYSLKTLKKTSRSFHSSTRLYYMTRNFYYLNSKYQNQFPGELKILKKDLLNRIKNKILYEPKRFSTLKNLYRAIQDFKNKRMGKLPD